MTLTNKRLPVALSASLLLAACGGSDATPAPDGGQGACALGTLPTSYDGSRYDAHTTAERDLRARFKALTQPMKDAEADLANKPPAATLRGLYGAGDPGLRARTSAPAAARVEGWLDAFAAAAGNTWAPAANPMGPGGRFGAYLFTAQGTDLRQAVEKTLFGAALYHHALSLTRGTVTAATMDRVLAIYGSHPSFPADTAAMMNPDELVAAYAKRRDKRDPQRPGAYLKIKAALIRAQAAEARGAACAAERDAALKAVLNEWERAMLATVVYYLNDVTKKLSAQSPTLADQAAALHGFGEAMGFILGFRQLPADGRIITDAQIDELQTTLGTPTDAPSSAYKLLTETAAWLPRLGKVASRIAEIYGFTPQQMEDFKTNF